MAKQIPELLKKRVNSLINMIFVRSGISSELGKQDSRFDYDVEYKTESDGTFTVFELVIYVELSGLDCDDCDFEIDSFSSTLKHWHTKLENAGSIGLNSDLTPTNSFDSLRGILLNEVSLKYSEIKTLSFTLHFDPVQN